MTPLKAKDFSSVGYRGRSLETHVLAGQKESEWICCELLIGAVWQELWHPLEADSHPCTTVGKKIRT